MGYEDDGMFLGQVRRAGIPVSLKN